MFGRRPSAERGLLSPHPTRSTSRRPAYGPRPVVHPPWIDGGLAWAPPPAYTARTLLPGAADRPHILPDAGDGRSDFAAYQRAAAATVRSRWVLRSAVAQLNGKDVSLLQQNRDPVAYLERELQADYG